jgi:hypothetical protein
MRTGSILAVALAAFLAAGAARATDTGGGGKDSAGASPSAGPSASSGSSTGTSASLYGGTGGGEGYIREGLTYGGLWDWRKLNRDEKPWEVGAVWETHVLVRQNDLEGAAANKVLDYMYFYARGDITARNRLSLRGGFYQRFLADDGETGYRMSDLTLTYTRIQPLPRDFVLRVAASLSAPTSFISQKMSLITAPTLSIQGGWHWRGLSIDARVFAQYYFVRYSTLEGGNPNPRTALGGYLEAEYAFWFFKPLTIGGDIYTEWDWYYDVANAGSPDMTFNGTTPNPQFPNQPAQQAYGGEIFLRYTPPPFARIHTDVTAAYAQGDPTLGYTSILHDGIGHIYPFWRQTSEFYFTIAARY